MAETIGCRYLAVVFVDIKLSEINQRHFGNQSAVLLLNRYLPQGNELGSALQYACLK